MANRQRIAFLLLIMTCVAASAATTTLVILYRAALEEERGHLNETAQSWARLIEAMARFDAQHSGDDVAGGAFAATMSQIQDAHGQFRGSGETGEFTLARLEGDEIVFLLGHRHYELDDPEPPVCDGNLGEPMRRALMGRSGSMVGLDCRGVPVLAAYEPVAELEVGIVNKIDLAEIREPFVTAGLTAGLVTLVLVFLGAVLFRRIGIPLIEGLEESEEKYRTLFESATEGIFLLSEHVVDCNDQACRLWACERGDILGRSPLHFSPLLQPDGRGSIRAAEEYVERALSGTPQFFYWRYERKDGTLMDAEVSLKRVEVGGEKMCLGAVRDITERRRTEGELRKLHQAVEQNPASIIITDAEGRIEYVNPMFMETTGYAPEEVIGRNARILKSGRQPEAYYKEMWETLRSGRVWRGEFHNRKKNGELYWEDAWISPIEDEAGGITHCVAVKVDTTKRKAVEEELRRHREDLEELVTDRTRELVAANEKLQQEIVERRRAEEEQARLSTAITQAAETIIITDARGVIQYVNPCFERNSGYLRDEAIGGRPHIVSSGKHDEAFYRDLWSTISQGNVWTGRFLNRRKDGTEYEEEATVSPVRDALGTIVNFVSVQRDITRESELEAQLRQAQKMEAIGTLAGGIAHDFNNILQATKGFAELALNSVSPGDRAYGHIEQMIRAQKRAEDLVKQILTFSRQTEAGTQPVHVGTVAEEVLGLLRSSLPPTIEIQQRLDPHCLAVQADPTQIHQILMNLCVNAYHAMEENGGTMTVTIETFDVSPEYATGYIDIDPGRYVRLSVADNGYGMDEETRQRIFEPYFTTKPEGKGTGLGLATVHGIVSGLGGAVRVYSEPGKGTEFKVYLPGLEGSEPTAPVADAPPRRGHGEHILLVDDEPNILTATGQSLEHLGYRVTTFLRPTEALDCYRAAPFDFDLAITDRSMPEMSGLALAGELLSARADLPIILLSGLNTVDVSMEARRFGLRDVLTKPIGQRELGHAIERALDAATTSPPVA